MAVGIDSRRALACAAAGVALACMPPPSADEPWPGAPGGTAEYHWPPRVQTTPTKPDGRGRAWPADPALSGAGAPTPLSGASSPAHAAHRPRPDPPPTPVPSLPSDGESCLARLASTGLVFERQRETRGVEVPVVLGSLVGGVEYWANDKRPLLVDCRLALALHHIAHLLRSHGVTRARFSGAYVYRNTRGGKLSLHARGLAIDIHDLTAHGRTFTVKADFSRGVGCNPDVPLLNRIACDLGRTQLFRELLTPDYDRDHHDHFHLAVGER